MDSNFNYINVTVNPVPNSDPHVYIFDVYNEMRAELLNIKIYFQLNYAENANDVHYKRELLRTVIDVEKFFTRGTSDFLMKYFIDAMLKSLSVKFVFPVKKVIKLFRGAKPKISSLFVCFQGMISYRNITIHDSIFVIHGRGRLIVRFVAKVEKVAKTVYLSTIKFFGEIS